MIILLPCERPPRAWPRAGIIDASGLGCLSQRGPDDLVLGFGIDCRRLDRACRAGRSGLAHAANSAGCPDEADPDVGLELQRA